MTEEQLQQLRQALIEAYCDDMGWEVGSEDGEAAEQMADVLMPVIAEHVTKAVS